MGSDSFVKPYIRQVVLKFYFNLLCSINDDQGQLFYNVHVLERWYDSNPKLIKKVLNCYYVNMIELEESEDITASIITNKINPTWPLKGPIHALSLSTA
ncbi:hypothetical protein J1N35_033517 [Gossypium stocksii]|uniref:Uncharacterized protein n=1 Tax=Gossypium stocksii TaxID=47602 RepID=A0A9D3UQB3_9ROSI|nr:hypothetical protein J1N35_033517 [Gossypium stocksii]